ncbi:MAG TPA: sulfotransferase family protein [Rhizobiales bacterium]|nr:sulfotransferase family protein [Hyphomicrobiales bacterium]
MVKASPKRGAARNKTVRPASKRICVLVLGMHRSGTSALTRVFNLLGCDLPQTLIGADRTNEPGHWEAAPVARLNDRLLESAGSRWDDWTEVNPDWFASPRAEEFREKAVEVLDAEFGKSRIFVLKDPRICRLAPFWLDVLDDAGIQPIVVIPLRNPRDVASSLQARNDFDPGFSNLLWLRHVLEAERATRGIPRCFTGYDDLLANWARVVEQIRTRIGIAWPRYSAQSAAEIDSFLSDRFRHHREGPESVIENPSLSRWIRESYAIFLDWIQSGERIEDYRRLDAIRDELNIASPAFGRLIAAGHEGRKTIGRLRKESAEQKVKLDAAVEAVARLEAREKELGAKIEGLRAKLAEESAALERALAEARSDLNLRSDEVEAARREIKELAGRLSHTESALAQRSLEAEQTAAELAKVRGQLAQRTAELDGVLRAKTEVEQSLDSARRAAEKASTEAAEFRDQLEQRSRDLEQIRLIRGHIRRPRNSSGIPQG